MSAQAPSNFYGSEQHPFPSGPLAFSWAALAQELGVGEDGAFNMAWIAVDRHVAAGRGERVAFRFLGEDERCRERRLLAFVGLRPAG